MTGRNWAADTMPSQSGSRGQLEDEPGLRDLLHPGADQGDRPGRRRTAGSCDGGTRSRLGSARRRGSSERGRSSAAPVWSRALRVRIGPAVELGEVRVEMGAPRPCVLDHRRQPGALGLERGDLASTRARASTMSGRRSSGSPVCGSARDCARGRLVLEQLADLGEREPGVVTEAPDEAQPLEVGRVEEAVAPSVRAAGSSRPISS